MPQQVPNWFLGTPALGDVPSPQPPPPFPGTSASLPQASSAGPFCRLGQSLALSDRVKSIFSVLLRFNTLTSCVHPDWPCGPEIIFVQLTGYLINLECSSWGIGGHQATAREMCFSGTCLSGFLAAPGKGVLTHTSQMRSSRRGLRKLMSSQTFLELIH